MSWIKRLLEKNKEIWHYTCENRHKWESWESPGGGIFAPSTTCPRCKSIICRGEVYINGKKTEMGAAHTDFK